MHAVNEDTHFYVDNAPPEEVAWVLRCLSVDQPLSNREIAQRVSEYGVGMQGDKTYSSRRLYDLGLANQTRQGSAVTYVLTSLGLKLQGIAAMDPQLYADLMHFLHYTRYDGAPESRKYLWSYRRCCDVVWAQQRLLSREEMAGVVQGDMKRDFPHLDFSAKKGGRFDETAAGRCYAWWRQLSPSPFVSDGDVLRWRRVQRFELALLALDHIYRDRGYRYGDPVVLDQAMLNDLARVFFLEPSCCRELLALGSTVTRAVALRDTFAGTSVSLLAPYTVKDI